MAIRIANEESLKALGAQTFANEVQLQRFIEDRVTPLCGLRLVSSSLRGRHRLGHIDSTAIDDEGSPVIIEYKWDRVDGDVMQQLFRYERWFLNHRELYDAEALTKWNQRTSNVAKPQLVAVGYRFHRTAAVDASGPVLCLRYGYRPDKTVSLLALDGEEVKTASVGRKPPNVNKDRVQGTQEIGSVSRSWPREVRRDQEAGDKGLDRGHSVRAGFNARRDCRPKAGWCFACRRCSRAAA